jgi:hypothetical protein
MAHSVRPPGQLEVDEHGSEDRDGAKRDDQSSASRECLQLLPSRIKIWAMPSVILTNTCRKMIGVCT